MKPINVKFLSMKVSGFNAQQGSISMEINFNDGNNKQVVRKTIIDDARALSNSIVDEIIQMEQRIHYEVDSRELKTVVHVNIHNEYEIVDRMTNFLSSISHMIKNIMVAKLADGYMDKIKSLNRMKIDF